MLLLLLLLLLALLLITGVPTAWGLLLPLIASPLLLLLLLAGLLGCVG